MAVSYQPKVRFDRGYDSSIKAVLGSCHSLHSGSMHTKDMSTQQTHYWGIQKGTHTTPQS